MKHLGALSVGLVMAIAQSAAWGQIYESRDEQGNPVFSDEPGDGDSSLVDLTETNIADAPAPAPGEPGAPAARGEDPAAVTTANPAAYQDPDEEYQ